MKTTVKVEGLSDLDASLGELTKATARSVLRRVLMKAGQPMAETAAALAPKDTLELSQSITVSPKIKNDVGRAEYHEVMQNFGTKEEAVAALRSARRAAKGAGSFVEVYVGPARADTKANAIKRIVAEFGSVKQPPHPYMRPAFDQNKDRALQIIREELGGEIAKAAARARKRAAIKAAKG